VVVGNVPYELEVVELRPGDVVERGGYRIEAFAVIHGGGAIGYALREDGRPGRFDVEAADALGVPDGPARGALQRGEAVTLEGGRVVRPDEVVGLARLGRSVVLTGDTAPAKSVVEAADGADVLVHEATFLADERARARETEHSTAAEAALVAREAGVGLLALTHLSARYSVSEVAEEARALFPQTVVPRDFDLLEVPLPERGAPKLVARGGRRGPREDVGSAA
jgi:ribonuclease Z